MSSTSQQYMPSIIDSAAEEAYNAVYDAHASRDDNYTNMKEFIMRILDDDHASNPETLKAITGWLY